jgi:hypothetical protein
LLRSSILARRGSASNQSTHLEPGFVWFKDRVGGLKSGVLIWSKQLGAKYRAGIKFLTLSRDAEQSVQERLARLKPHTPLRDPEEIIATLIAPIDRNGN